MMMRSFTLWSTSLALAFVLVLVRPARADFFQTYFNAKVFGPNPGPCPNYGDCVGDLANVEDFPESIRKVRICLFPPNFLCQNVEDWVRSGTVTIWEVECEDLRVDSIVLSPTSFGTTSVPGRFSVNDVEQRCTGKIEFDRAVLVIDAGFFDITIRITTRNCCSANGGIIWSSENFGNDDALNINFDLDFNIINRAATPENELLTGFDDYIVNELVVDNCDMALNLGLELFDVNNAGLWDEITIFGALDISGIAGVQISNLLVLILEGLFGSVICAAIEQVDYLSQNSNSGPVGILNELVEEANVAYDELKAPTTVDVDAQDLAFRTNPTQFDVTPADLANAFRFDNSLAFELLSVTINDFLGGLDDQGSPAINQAINLLTEPDGTFSFDASDSNISIEIPINVANVTLGLDGFTVEGINQITTLQLLANNFGGGGAQNFYTVNNSFGIGPGVVISVNISVLLERGTWVTASSCGTIGNSFSNPNCDDTERFTFTFGITTTGPLDFEASILSAFNLEEIEDTFIGQVLNDQYSISLLDGAKQSVQCVAPAIYQLNFTELTASLGGFDDPVVTDFSGPELSALIATVTEVVGHVFKAVLAKDLPFILRGAVRTAANDFLKTEVADIDTLANCVPYVPNDPLSTKTNFLRFNEFPITEVFTVINEVLGNLGTGSDVDLNGFIQTMFEYASAEFASFPFDPHPTIEGDWVSKPEFFTVFDVPPYRTAFSSGTAYIRAFGTELKNVNSISSFGANYTGPLGFDFNLTIGGSAGEELGVFVNIDFRADELGIDEQWVVSLTFENLFIDTGLDPFFVDLDLFDALKIGQLTTIPCLVSVIENITIAKSILSIVTFDPGLDRSASSPGSASTDFGAAAALLETELTNAPSLKFTTMLNTVLEGSYNFLWKSIAEQDFASLDPLNCSTSEDNVGSLINVFLGFNFPNLTQLAEVCLKDVAKLSEEDLIDYERTQLGITTPNDLPASFFDFTTSIIIPVIDFFIGGDSSGSGSTLNDVLVTIANSTGNPLSDLLILEEDGTTVSLALQLNTSNFLFDLFGISPLSITGDTVIPGLILEAQVLRVKGVNKFLDNYEILQVISNFTTRNSIRFADTESLAIEITGLFQADAKFQNPSALPSDPPLVEEMIFTLNASGLEIDLDVLFALNTDIFANLTLGHFLATDPTQDIFLSDTAVNCLFFSTFPGGFSIPQFRLNISSVTGPEFKTNGNVILSPGLEGVINQTTILLKEFYLDAVPNICQNCIREFLNDQLTLLYEASQEPGACPSVIPPIPLPVADQIFRFNTSSFLTGFQDFLSTNFYADDFKLWNEVMATLTADPLFPSEEFFIVKDLGLFYKGQFYGDLTISVTNLIITGLNTFRDLEIIEPTTYDQYRIRNSLNIEGPLKVIGDYRIIGDRLFQEGPYIVNEAKIEFELEKIITGIEVILQVNLSEALGLRFSSVSSFEEIPCLLIPVNQLEPTEVNFTTSSIIIAFECGGICDAPLLDSLSAAGEYRSNNGEELSTIIATVFNFTRDYIASSEAQDLIDAGIANAEESCAELLGIITSLFPSGNSDFNVFEIMGFVFVGFSGFSAVGVAALLPLHRRRAKLYWTKKSQSTREQELRELQLKSLIQHPAVPLFMKGFIPAFCLMNIVFLFWSILFSAAFKIVITFTVVGLTVNEITLVPFTIISSVNDIWNSGAWPLSILIGVASCAWPIVKNTILMIIFFLPTTLLSEQKRAWYLELLDILGKWSLLDVFVVIMTLAGLKTYVVLSQQAQLGFLDESFFAADANVVPQRGIILLCFVAASSLIINHVQAFYHMKAVSYNHKIEDEIKGTEIPVKVLRRRAAVADYKFLPNRRTGTMRVASRRATRILLIINFISAGIVFVCSFLPLLTFDLNGIVGLFLELIDEPLAKKSYSLLDLGLIVAEAPQNNLYDSIVILFFQTLFFLTGIVFPLLMAFTNAVLFLRSFTLREHKTLMFIAMIISFWAALECFMVGVVITVLEIGVVTKFIVDFITDDICTSIESLLVAAIGEVDGACLDVVGTLEYGAYPLIIMVFVQLTCSTFILVFSNAVIQDRYFKRYRGKRADAKPPKSGFARRKIIQALTLKVKARQLSTPNPIGGQLRNTVNPIGQGQEGQGRVGADLFPITPSKERDSESGSRVTPIPFIPPVKRKKQKTKPQNDPFPELEESIVSGGSSSQQKPKKKTKKRKDSVDSDFF